MSLSKATRRRALAASLVLALGIALYTAGATTNPPGFYIDESSIAYNAYCISRHGRDEYGTAWPLYFRAFGEYKNPTYIYLLAALFYFSGPSILVARLLSNVAGVTAAVLLGLLAHRLTKREGMGSLLTVSALLTPWLFENSRTVFEVALYPLLIVLLLLALQRASTKARWKAAEIISLAVILALLTYTASIGRLLGPLLALGLALFMTRKRWANICQAWLVYLVLLMPLFFFSWRNPQALTARFRALTYIERHSTVGEIAGQFIRHYLANLSPWKLLVSGGLDLRDHVPVMGMLLVATAALALTGIFLIVRYQLSDAWWRFVLYGLAVSLIPAALTDNDFPILRLVAFPVFVLVLTVPSWVWLQGKVGERSKPGRAADDSLIVSERRGYSHSTLKRVAMILMLISTVLQGAIFQYLYHQRGQGRGYIFDSHYPRVLKMVEATASSPVYLSDRPGASGYIQAYWYGALSGMDSARFIRLPPETRPPAHGLVISTNEQCSDCRLLLKSIHYIVYLYRGGEATARRAPLSDDQYRAKLSLLNPMTQLQAGQKQTLDVLVENTSNTEWSSEGEGDGKYAITLRGAWLRPTGEKLSDRDDAGTLPADLKPGQSISIPLAVTAPHTLGDHILEIDLAQSNASWFVRPPDLQEYIYERDVAQQHVTWFHEKGGTPLRLRVQVR